VNAGNAFLFCERLCVVCDSFFTPLVFFLSLTDEQAARVSGRRLCVLFCRRLCLLCESFLTLLLFFLSLTDEKSCRVWMPRCGIYFVR